MPANLIGVFFLLICCSLQCLTAQPVIQRVRDAGAIRVAADESILAPGGFFILEGTDLGWREFQALAPPYPASLSGVAVRANGLPCPLVSVSPTRVVAILPYAVADPSQRSVLIVLDTQSRTSNPVQVSWGILPAILTSEREGNGHAVVFDESLAPISQVTPGQTVIVPVMGLGPTDPPIADGVAAPAKEPLPGPIHVVRILFTSAEGNTDAQVLSTTLAPGQVGVYHVKFVVPEGGSTVLGVLSDEGRWHAAVLPQPAPPTSFSNVSGAVESIFGNGPLSAPGWSPLLAAARFRLSLHVTPGTGPFTIEFKGPAGGVVIQVRPTEGTWSALATVPSEPSRFGDFSGSSFTVNDFLSGHPMPGNVVPLVRIPAFYLTAVQSMSLPNMPGADRSVGSLMSVGSIPKDGALVFDSATTPGAVLTGGWVPIAAPAPATYTETFTLWVDGQRVAGADIVVPVLPPT